VDRAIGRRLCPEKVADPAETEAEGPRSSRRLGRERERGVFEDVHRFDRSQGRAVIARLRRKQSSDRAGQRECETSGRPEQADHGGMESAIGHLWAISSEERVAARPGTGGAHATIMAPMCELLMSGASVPIQLKKTAGHKAGGCSA
jgi:hypothetical protein